MTGQLDGRAALVTGGAAGIGEGIVRRFAAEGARVVVADVSEDAGHALAAEVGGVFVRTDVTVKVDVLAAVATTVDSFGTIDVLVNNAWAGGSISRVEHKADAALLAGIQMAYLAAFWAMQASVDHMRRGRWGRVVNMVSLNGVNAHMGSLEYNAAKEALRALTRTAAREWAPDGITVNAIAPAAVTPAFLSVIDGNPDLLALAGAANPMGRMGDPYDDVAPVAVFLASEASRYLTGNTLFVDGGSHINGVAWAPDLSGSVPAE